MLGPFRRLCLGPMYKTEYRFINQVHQICSHRHFQSIWMLHPEFQLLRPKVRLGLSAPAGLGVGGSGPGWPVAGTVGRGGSWMR